MIAYVSFVIDCKELKIAQTAQSNQLFRFFKFNLYIPDGLPRMLMSKNVNNDVMMNLPIAILTLTSPFDIYVQSESNWFLFYSSNTGITKTMFVNSDVSSKE